MPFRILVGARQTQFPESIILCWWLYLALVWFPGKCAIFPRSLGFTKPPPKHIPYHTKWYALKGASKPNRKICCFAFFFSCSLSLSHTEAHCIWAIVSNSIQNRNTECHKFHCYTQVSYNACWRRCFFVCHRRCCCCLCTLYSTNNLIECSWILHMIPLRSI